MTKTEERTHHAVHTLLLRLKGNSFAVAAASALTLGLVTVAAHAEPGEYRFVDVRTMNGPCCTDEGTDLAVDEDGSVLISGFRGSIDLDHDGRIDIPTFGAPDALVSKFTLVGNENTGWTRGPGGPLGDGARGVAPDRQGGVYIVGSFTDFMELEDIPNLETAGQVDGFLVRYAANGRAMWARAVGGGMADGLQDVASDENGNAILIGNVIGPVDVDRDGNIDVTASNEGQALIASYSPAGIFRWARLSGGTARAWGLSVAARAGNEIYIAGRYEKGAPDFDGDGTPELPVAEPPTPELMKLMDPMKFDHNGFYARLDDKGVPVWIKGVSGPGVQVVTSLTVAPDGDLLVSGLHGGQSDFDGDGEADLEFRSMADRMYRYHADANTFLMRVTPDGERVWTKGYTAWAEHVAANESRIVLSGTYSNALDVDGDGIPEREADDDEFQEGFSAILDNEGNLLQVLTVVGRHRDLVNAAGFSPDGSMLYLTGHVSLGADFDGDDKVETASVCHKAGEMYLATFAMKE